jgi:hypothetical protein
MIARSIRYHVQKYSLKHDRLKNGLSLKLELSADISNLSKDSSFAKSKRINHFLDKHKAVHPQLATVLTDI